MAATSIWGGAARPPTQTVFNVPRQIVKRQPEATDESTFADLRAMEYPEDPAGLETGWPLKSSVASPPNDGLSFKPGDMPIRQARWMFYQRLSCAGIFVNV